jgi:hypothetical protein
MSDPFVTPEQERVNEGQSERESALRIQSLSRIRTNANSLCH